MSATISQYMRILLVLALVLGASGAAAAAPLVPDLTVSIANVEHWRNNNGEEALLFDTHIENRGSGALELRMGPLTNGNRPVHQRVFDSAGGYTDHYVGTFPFVGSQIRFPHSASYYLREVNEDGSMGAIVAAREKVAYCLVDSWPVQPPVPGTAPTRTYNSCGDVLGISVGWYDNYDSGIPTQHFVLIGISSGTYYIHNILDPLNRFIEQNDGNNEGHTAATFANSYAPEVAVLGNGVAVANNDTSASAADHTHFGYADPASGIVTRTFTIQNSGSGTLSLTGVPKVKISGSSEFSVVAMPASPVAASGSTTFQVTYDPNGLNSNAEVLIVNNDADEAPYRFAIAGNTDADGDGMPDDWEAQHNLDDPAADEDRDGASNRDEFIAGTSPRDAQSSFRSEARRNGGSFEVTWTSVAGRTYKLYSRSDLLSATPGLDGWQFVGEWQGTGAPIAAPVSVEGTSQLFFRVTTGF